MTQGLPGSTGHRARNRATHVEVNILAVLDEGFDALPLHQFSGCLKWLPLFFDLRKQTSSDYSNTSHRVIVYLVSIPGKDVCNYDY